MSGAKIDSLVFGNAPRGGPGGRDVIVNVFLRGGMDALSFLIPYTDQIYYDKRSRLAITQDRLIQLSSEQYTPFGQVMGLHPSASGLHQIMNNHQLAIVGAAGSPSASRSHFEAQDYMDRGKPDDDNFFGGWLARYLNSIGGEGVFRAISRSSTLDVSLENFAGALALSNADGFSISGSSSHRDDLRRALRLVYESDSKLREVAMATLDATDFIDFADPGDYVPGNGAEYPDGSFADSLASVAQMIRLDIGLQAATINLGGWDTHEGQASSGDSSHTGNFANLINTLSEGLSAFWLDLTDLHDRVTVVVMSEFGRRLKENNNNGTDHGHGGMMMVLSDGIENGGVYGSWPGLDENQGQLFQGNDLQVTTDFRTVLSEIMIARMNFFDVGSIFPQYSYVGPTGMFGTAGQIPPPPLGLRVK